MQRKKAAVKAKPKAPSKRRPVARKKPGVGFTLVARVSERKAEIVRVPTEPGVGEEKVIMSGKLPARRSARGSIIRDASGQRALEVFRQAVREAKQK